MAAIQVWVVIPWRGFRCFTQVADVVRAVQMRYRCNPLAGI